MKAMLTGVTGQLGLELIRQVDDCALEVVPVSEDDLDITNFDDVQKTIQDIRLFSNKTDALLETLLKADSEWFVKSFMKMVK